VEPWHERLSQGDTRAAWDLFIDRYRRLIFATIRRIVEDDDHVLEVFAHVCERLSANGLARLERYSEGDRRKARFSTWLVVVVRNQTIDWVRRREGRRRVRPPAALSPIQREIFRHVFADRRSHSEAYELVSAGATDGIGFGSFLRELAETYRVVEHSRGKGAVRYFGPTSEPARSVASPETAYVRSELRERLASALEAFPADVRLAVQLFVVEGLSAADVARTVGWPNAKAVYNRVHRTLRALRKELQELGLRPSDL
jgi:RNA polymerase sigma factor (sigma-70 family)